MATVSFFFVTAPCQQQLSDKPAILATDYEVCTANWQFCPEQVNSFGVASIILREGNSFADSFIVLSSLFYAADSHVVLDIIKKLFT